MEELYSSRIVTEDNFHYSLTDDTINRLAVKVVLRDVQPVPWHEAVPLYTRLRRDCCMQPNWL